MKFDEIYEKSNVGLFNEINFFFFAILVLLLSPNYLMQIFPIFKFFWIGCFALFFLFFLIHFKRIKISQSAIFLILFYIILFFGSVIGFLRYANMEGVYFSFGISAKFLLIYLFLMSCNIYNFIKIIKMLICVFLILCLHSLVGWFLYLMGLSHVTNIVEISTYYYNVMSIWGVYTVSLPLGWGEVIRNQSFFQEPGSFAFYIFVVMILLVALKKFFKKIHYNYIYMFLFLTMLTTLSATGIVLSILLSLFIFKSKFLNVIFSVICMFILSYILFSDNPYVNKIGSFEERLYGITQGIEIFFQDPLTLIFGSGYNSEVFFDFDGKFNNFILEIILYSGIVNLIVFSIFLFSLRVLEKQTKFFYFLVLVFCATTPLFWSPMMLVFNLFMLRFVEVQRGINS